MLVPTLLGTSDYTDINPLRLEYQEANTEYYLKIDKENKPIRSDKQGRRLVKYKQHICLLNHGIKSIDMFVYVEPHKYRLQEKKLTQAMAWKSKRADDCGIKHRPISYVLEEYPALISDVLHTDTQRTYWLHSLYEFYDKLFVYAYTMQQAKLFPLYCLASANETVSNVAKRDSIRILAITTPLKV